MSDEERAQCVLAMEALPFTEVDSDEPDELLRKWLIREIIHPDTPMNKATIQFLEDLFQWTRNGIQEPKIKAVK